MSEFSGGSVSAGDISRNFGEWQGKALQAPVTITHHGRPRLVLSSVEAFESPRAGMAVTGGSNMLAAQFQAVLNQMKEAFYALDAEFRVIDVNPSASLYFGQTKEALVGRDLRDAVPGVRNSIAWDFFRQVLRNGEAREFTTRAELHGQTRLRFKAFPYDGGGVGVIFGTVGEAEEAEMWRKRWAALAGSQQTRRYLSVISLNGRGEILSVDDNFIALSGFNRQHLVNRPLAEMVSTENVGDLLKALNVALRSNDVQGAMLTLITRAGSTRLLDLRIAPLAGDIVSEEILVSIVDLSQIDSLRKLEPED